MTKQAMPDLLLLPCSILLLVVLVVHRASRINPVYHRISSPPPSLSRTVSWRIASSCAVLFPPSLSPLHSPCTRRRRGLEKEEGHTDTRTFPAHERPLSTYSIFFEHKTQHPATWLTTQLSVSTITRSTGFIPGLAQAHTQPTPPHGHDLHARPHAPTTRSPRPLPTHC